MAREPVKEKGSEIAQEIREKTADEYLKDAQRNLPRRIPVKRDQSNQSE